MFNAAFKTCAKSAYAERPHNPLNTGAAWLCLPLSTQMIRHELNKGLHPGTPPMDCHQAGTPVLVLWPFILFIIETLNSALNPEPKGLGSPNQGQGAPDSMGHRIIADLKPLHRQDGS